MDSSSQPDMENIIEKYKDRGFYRWLLEDKDYILQNIDKIHDLDSWIEHNYKEYENVVINRVNKVQSIYQCNDCGSRDIKRDVIQSRRADEPVAIFITCIICGCSRRL